MKMGDLNTFLERIVALRQAIADDGIMNGVPFRSEDLAYLAERLRCEGSSFVKVTCPQLGKALDAALISGHFSCPPNFATRKGTHLPKFLYSLFERILDNLGDLRSEPDLTTVFFLRQFLSLDGKLITEPTKKQKEDAVNGFIDRQRRLGETRLPKDHPILQRAQRLLTRMLKRCSLDVITPGHGPGGVAEGYDRFERWDIRSWPSRAERWYPFHEYGSQSFRALCSQGPPMMVKNSITKCSLVPKDYKGPRLISSESTATQYLQQGQMKLLMRYVDSHWLMGKSIRFQDQTWNQAKCLSAFEDGSATLDLSNASDTVSAALVWYLLSGVPKLRSQLFCTRSQYMNVEGQRVRITAFSPMGSAVCFPVETLVFWALTMASVRFVQFQWTMSDAGGRPVGSKDPMIPSESEMASAIAVFGDDIIVPDYALAVLIGTLTSVGCEVNTSKTCYQTPFRESCGAEYFNHTDVAIIRNRRYDYDDSKKLISNPVLLDLQRKFFLVGLYSTAALLRQWAIEISPTITLIPREVERLLDSGKKLYFRWRRALPMGRVCVNGQNDPGVPLNTHRVGLLYCHTAVPSSLPRGVREAGTFDDLCCAFGSEPSLSCGVRTRYNKDLQRMECRLPRVFQHTREWPHQQFIRAEGSRRNGETSQDKTGLRNPAHKYKPVVKKTGDNLCGEQPRLYGNVFLRNEGGVSDRRVTPNLESGYPRLLSRVVGDSVERIAIRTNLLVKMAWSELPPSLVSQLDKL
jgi:hypothetical protein